MRINPVRAQFLNYAQRSLAPQAGVPSSGAGPVRGAASPRTFRVASSDPNAAGVPPRAAGPLPAVVRAAEQRIMAAAAGAAAALRDLRGGGPPDSTAAGQSPDREPLAAVLESLRAAAGARDDGGVDVAAVDPGQVAAVDVKAFAAGTRKTYAGAVVAAAERAEVEYLGRGGRVVDGAAFRLSGGRGSVRLAVAAGETLGAVAARVNGESSRTGVIAVVDDDRLAFRSVEAGSAGSVRIDEVAGRTSVAVSGADAAGLTEFAVTPAADAAGTTHTLDGAVTQAADRGRLTYQGLADGLAAHSGTFVVNGTLGRAEVSVAAGESLADVADRTNRLAAVTGVEAVLDGDDLVFRTAALGSDAHLSVGFRSAAIDPAVSGLDPSQISAFSVDAIGPDADVTLSGRLVRSAERAELTYLGGPGGTVTDSAEFTVAGGGGGVALSMTRGESLADVAARVNAVTGETGVTAAVDGDALLFRSVDAGGAALLSVRATRVDDRLAVSGADGVGIAAFSVDALRSYGVTTLSGEVLNVREKARLVYAGTAAGRVTNTAAFTLTGDAGAADVALTEGESLSAVADRVNALTGRTGVAARVDGTNLVLESVGAGASADVGVRLTSLQKVSGVDPSRIAGFTVVSSAADATRTVAGTVTAAAIKAQLTHSTTDGKIGLNAAFDLAGVRGKVNISVTMGETLAAVRDRVNAQTAATGVAARVDGNSLVFESDAYGSAQTAALTVTRGKFDVAGGTVLKSLGVSTMTAKGTDAQATINGAAVTGVGNRLTYSDAGGSYAIDVAAGYQGGLGTVTIASAADAFRLSGGDGAGTAQGRDARALVNGQVVTERDGAFAVSDAVGDYTLRFAGGFVGAFGPVRVGHAAGAFAVAGGDGVGSDRGADAEAMVNGRLLTARGAEFSVEEASGRFTVRFADGFAGDFAPVRIVTSSSRLVVAGGDGGGNAAGVDAVGVFGGVEVTGRGNRFSFADGFGSYRLAVAEGFAGALGSISLTARAGGFAVAGGDGSGGDVGRDAEALINGRLVTGRGSRFALADAGSEVELEFAEGFTGRFSPVTVSRERPLTEAIDGLTFALSDDPAALARPSLPGLRPERLGLAGGEFRSADGDEGPDGRAADAAVRDLDLKRRMLGMFSAAAFEAMVGSLFDPARGPGPPRRFAPPGLLGAPGPVGTVEDAAAAATRLRPGDLDAVSSEWDPARRARLLGLLRPAGPAAVPASRVAFPPGGSVRPAPAVGASPSDAG